MELYSKYGSVLILYGHYMASITFSQDMNSVRNTILVDYPGMVQPDFGRFFTRCNTAVLDPIYFELMAMSYISQID